MTNPPHESAAFLVFINFEERDSLIWRSTALFCFCFFFRKKETHVLLTVFDMRAHIVSTCWKVMAGDPDSCLALGPAIFSITRSSHATEPQGAQRPEEPWIPAMLHSLLCGQKCRLPASSTTEQQWHMKHCDSLASYSISRKIQGSSKQSGLVLPW